MRIEWNNTTLQYCLQSVRKNCKMLVVVGGGRHLGPYFSAGAREIQSSRPLFRAAAVSRENGNKPWDPSPDGGERKGNKRSNHHRRRRRQRRTPASRWPVHCKSARPSVGVVKARHANRIATTILCGPHGFYISLIICTHLLPYTAVELIYYYNDDPLVSM